MAASPKTFCNPLNLDYGTRTNNQELYRHGADPVVVLFKNRYYLFSTWDKPGYRVSDDLVNWTTIPFAAPDTIVGKTYTAAAVMEMDGYLYYTELGSSKRPPVCIYRTNDPDSGKWEKVSEPLPLYADPCLFLDPASKKLFMYFGLDNPICGVELDTKTFTEIGTPMQLLPTLDFTLPTRDGWEVCTWDNNPKSPGMRSTKTSNACREGAWMTLHNGTYYLQYASPGTTVPGYSDGIYTSKSPLGPFTYDQHSPISQKSSGFITSAGHSCLFQDRHGNWWRAVTMLIGVRQRMERRIGLFPAGFDADGVPYTRTDCDLPITLPDGKRDHLGPIYTDRAIASENKPAAVSSTLKGHEATLANDEDIRTCWSAETGDAGEWFQLDLASEREIHAVQINLAEQDGRESDDSSDHHRFTVEISSDAKTWTKIADTSAQTHATPHFYFELNTPQRARYVKLTNVFTPAAGKFAVADLRVFAAPDAPKIEPVKGFRATRNPDDRRVAEFNWAPAPNATGYVLRYGIAKDKLYQHHLIKGGDGRTFTLYSLNQAPPYFFRLDPVREGRPISTDAPLMSCP